MDLLEQTSLCDLTSLNIKDDDFQSGDKVVYYDNSNTIDGLINNETYFVLREDIDNIKLCKYKSDVVDSNPVAITSITTPSALNESFILKVNPPLEFITGNVITFDVSDQSLLDMKLDFYEDLNFNQRLDVNGTNDTGFNIIRDGITGNANATVKITTNTDWQPRKTFYNLTPVVPSDVERHMELLTQKLQVETI